MGKGLRSWLRTGLVIASCSSFGAGALAAEPPATPIGAVAGASAEPSDPALEAKRAQARYAAMVRRVASMYENERVATRAWRHGLEVLPLTWEDTGRYEGSSVGPNISDVTIEVEMKVNGKRRTALMPVMRHPNFSDKTGDVKLDEIWLPVGNHRADGSLEHVTLRDFLADPGRYMSKPDSGAIRTGSLLAPRDSHALVSAQATFLPIPDGGEATFWPVICNYQSTREHPAVLTLLVTRQGTSMTVVDNARDTVSDSWGQRLFFNHEGERAPLTAERLSTVQANGETANGEAASTLGDDANVLMIVQVPLKLPRRRAAPLKAPIAMDMLFDGGGGMGTAKSGAGAELRRERDVETAVLGHGPVLGPYTELAGKRVARDPRFPVRVTVQFYQATTHGAPSAAEIKQLAQQIKKVYASADYVGSLVVPSAADRQRPTAWTGMSPPPAAPMCSDFAGLVERNLCM